MVAIVDGSGRYQVEVRAVGGEGSYSYTELARRSATEADRELVAGDRAYHRLRKKYQQAPKEVIEGLMPVAELWRSRGLHRRRADTLVPLGRAWSSLGDAEQALAIGEEVLAWYRLFRASHLLAPVLRWTAVAHLSLGQARQARG